MPEQKENQENKAEEKTNSHKTKKCEFVEIEFLGRNLQTNDVFDTNIPEESKKLNPKADENEIKPLAVCIGRRMLVNGFDNALEGKEIGKKYSIKLSPDDAFGKRQANLVRLIPMKMFLEQKIYPQPGMTLALDNALVKVVSVSGGRVLVDFNNPLAGKEVEYEFTIKKIVSDIREKISALQKFFFGHEFEFDINEKEKKIIFKDLKLTPVINAFKDKFKEILDFDVEILAKPEKEKKEDKKDEKKEENKDSKEE